MEKITHIGVIVGRFQCPELTEGHRWLIEQVEDRVDELLIFIGNHKSQPTRRNPLSYEVRKHLVKAVVPKSYIESIDDHISNEVWSQQLDEKIDKLCKGMKVTLFCSRDGFIKVYSGKYNVEELETPHRISATEMRFRASKEIIATTQFAKGIIYSVFNRIPSPYMCVDIAVYNPRKKEFVFCKKAGERFYRFIGGFLDSGDESITKAALREVMEETGGVGVFDGMKLIGEAKIRDWRYESDEENIFTNLFYCKWVDGRIIPADDISVLVHLPVDEIQEELFMPQHRQLLKILLLHINQKTL